MVRLEILSNFHSRLRDTTFVPSIIDRCIENLLVCFGKIIFRFRFEVSVERSVEHLKILHVSIWLSWAFGLGNSLHVTAFGFGNLVALILYEIFKGNPNFHRGDFGFESRRQLLKHCMAPDVLMFLGLCLQPLEYGALMSSDFASSKIRIVFGNLEGDFQKIQGSG